MRLTGHHRLTDGHARHDTRGLDLNARALGVSKWTLAIDWLTNTINDTGKHAITGWDIHNSTGTLDGVTLTDFTIVTEDHNTDRVGVEVKGHTLETRGRELDELTSAALSETVNGGDTVTDGEDTADLIDVGLGIERLDALFEDATDLSSTDGGGCEGRGGTAQR